jgi:2-C-methyl-D-erythritol 4-phosphate cytidylyltransferase
MPKSNRYWVVIPAAGIGKRMGSDIPKQYISVCGKTIIEHTIENFIDRNDIESICVAISKSDHYWSTLKGEKMESQMIAESLLELAIVTGCQQAVTIMQIAIGDTISGNIL